MAEHVALTRVKAGGKFYEVGEVVPKQDDSDALVAAGVLGSASDAKALQKKAETDANTIAELEAKVAELTAELEQAQLDQANATADTQESVTDAEAKKIGN